MKNIAFRTITTTFALFLLLAVNPAQSKPDGDQGKGHGNHGGPGKSHSKDQGKNRGGNPGDHKRGSQDWDRGSNSGDSVNININFGDRQRSVVREYYTEQFHHGHCPPGLAKKGNGCMPPGQARKWRMGYPLPRDVVYYELPPQVIIDMGPPPAGYKYVRVAADILMIAVGTGMVVDAIEDLSNM